MSLYRQPAGEWLAMDATTSLGPAGAALRAVAYDASRRARR